MLNCSFTQFQGHQAKYHCRYRYHVRNAAHFGKRCKGRPDLQNAQDSFHQCQRWAYESKRSVPVDRRNVISAQYFFGSPTHNAAGTLVVADSGIARRNFQFTGSAVAFRNCRGYLPLGAAILAQCALYARKRHLIPWPKICSMCRPSLKVLHEKVPGKCSPGT